MKNFKDKYERSTCLDEFDINRYVQHKCSDKERQEIEGHLVECPLCRSEVVFLIKDKNEIQGEKKWVELPDRLFNKGMALVNKMPKIQKISLLEICLRFFCEHWEIVRHTGMVIPQTVLAGRGELPEKKAIISSIAKEFDEFQIIVDVKGDGEGSIDLRVRIKRLKDGVLEPQVQFTLWDQKRERVLKEFIRDGEITFEGIIPGVYSVRIALNKRDIGEINIDLTG